MSCLFNEKAITLKYAATLSGFILLLIILLISCSKNKIEIFYSIKIILWLASDLDWLNPVITKLGDNV